MLADHIGVPHLRNLAGRSEQRRESIGVSAMPRLAELLYADAALEGGPLELRVDFLGGMQGFPEIRGHIGGQLAICCQRCLGQLDWQVDIDFHLIVIESEEDFDQVAEPFDTLIAGEHGICLKEVVEDEVLASLPLAPMHKSGDVCEPKGKVEIVAASVVDVGPETNKPFGDLAALMQDAASPDEEN